MISTFSNIARQDIYNILTELQELSLVQIVIGSPTLFKAVSLQDAIDILNKRKKEKMSDLLSEARELLKASMFIKESKTEREKYRFVLIPKKEGCIKQVKKLIESAQESIFVITPWREATQWLFILHDSWEKALSRGIEVLE
jgi:sugar-specific transcriptional regulator TrmB